jgi:hypothetical protein
MPDGFPLCGFVSFVADEGFRTVLENRPTFLGREAEPPGQCFTGREPGNEVYGLKLCWFEEASWKGAITSAGESKLLASSATKRTGGGASRTVRKMLGHLDQSSITSPDTRANSLRFPVTRIIPRECAWPAINTS